MDFHIWFGTAHRRLTRPAHSSCPYPGDEWRKLPPRHQQEGTTAIGSGAKPNPKDTKRRRPRHQNMNRHGSTKINRGVIAPFRLNRSVHFLAAIWHNLSPPLTAGHLHARSGRNAIQSLSQGKIRSAHSRRKIWESRPYSDHEKARRNGKCSPARWAGHGQNLDLDQNGYSSSLLERLR